MKEITRHCKLAFASLLATLLIGCASVPSSSVSANNMAKDGIITNAVKTSFQTDAQLRGSRIDISTYHGVVTLRGVVDSLAQKKRAERVARETAGVTSVNDHLNIAH